MSLPPPPTNNIPLVEKQPRVLSCLLCSQRKVKCDRKTPCSNCTKARQECISIASLPPRRRKKRFAEAELLTRLRHYEELLKKNGIGLDEVNEKINRLAIVNENKATTKTPHSSEIATGLGVEETGKLIVSGSSDGSSTYLNNNLWTGLSDEFRDTEEVLQGSSEDELDLTPTVITSYNAIYPNDGGYLLFGAQSSKSSLMALHPDPIHIFQLWQTFIDNVNPLIKIIHIPTTQKSLLASSGNLKDISKPMEVLMFAIYSMAILSLEDTRCVYLFGQERAKLLAKYQSATQQALVNAGFLKSSNIMVLQALLLYLLSIRERTDTRSLFLLTGLAVRTAQRMGLHKNTTTHLPPFQTEFRHRLWWQIVILDSRAAELCGTGASILNQYLTTPLPLNVNDSDLYPDMKNFPKEGGGGITEMSFCLMRCEIGTFLMESQKLRKWRDESGFSGNWQAMTSPQIPVEEKDRIINELEQKLDSKYVSHCDIRIPFHFMVTMMARGAICKMRLVAHHPRLQSDKGISIPPLERENLFNWSLTLIEYHNKVTTHSHTRGFIWHINTNMPVDAYICLLSELRRRPTGELPDRAWGQIEQIFDKNRPKINTMVTPPPDGERIKMTDMWFFKNPNDSFHTALSNLVVKAWEAREHALNLSGNTPSTPTFITQLREALKSKKSTRKGGETLLAMNKEKRDGDFCSATMETGNASLDMDISRADLPPNLSWDLPPNSQAHLNFQPGLYPQQLTTSSSQGSQLALDLETAHLNSNPVATSSINADNQGEMGDMANMMDWGFWDEMMGFSEGGMDMEEFEGVDVLGFDPLVG